MPVAVVVAASSVTLPVMLPARVGASLAPVSVTVMVWAVDCAEAASVTMAEKVSVTEASAANASVSVSVLSSV